MFYSQAGALNLTERMRIVSGGNVAIGGSSASERVDLNGGNIAMGWERVVNSCGAVLNCTATCTGTKRAVGGSCAGSGSWVFIYSSGGDSSYGCSAQVAPATSLIATVYCANIR